MSYFDNQRMEQVGLWFMVGVTGLGCLVSVFVRPKLRRAIIDKKGT